MVEEVYTQRELPEKDTKEDPGMEIGWRIRARQLATHIRRFPEPTSGKPMPEVSSV